MPDEANVTEMCIRYVQNYNFACCLYGCETWSVTLRDERRLRVVENGILKRIFGPKMDEVTGVGEYYITRRLMFCTHHQIIFE
jgi:hypothetical protein